MKPERRRGGGWAGWPSPRTAKDRHEAFKVRLNAAQAEHFHDTGRDPQALVRAVDKATGRGSDG